MLLREVFPGSSTPRGFYSLFEHIAADRDYVYMLKGGPGVGKSSLMRSIAQVAEENGYDVELFPCASAPRSLDGIRIPKLNIVMTDATSPHESDPIVPGVRDEIINLGAHLSRTFLHKHEARVTELHRAVNACFRRGSRFLAACAPLNDEIAQLYRESTDSAVYARLSSELSSVLHEIGTQGTGVRRFFASAIGGDGIVNRLDSLLKREQRFVLNAPYPGYWSNALTSIALEMNKHAIAYHDPLNPEHVIHIDLPTVNAAVITSCPAHAVAKEDGDIWTDCSEALLAHPLSQRMDMIEDAQNSRDGLISRATAAFSEAMRLHDELESYYIEAMDFSRNDIIKDELTAQIFG